MLRPNIKELEAFYNTSLGKVVVRPLRSIIKDFWESSFTRNDSVLGIGFTNPYLRIFSGETEKVFSFMPKQQGMASWNNGRKNSSLLGDETRLPFPDSSIDKIILAHSIEFSENLSLFLREVWRVLTPGGRVILILPNRKGVWSIAGNTPFGHGRPYTSWQLENILIDSMFCPLQKKTAVLFPPIKSRVILRIMMILDKPLGFTLREFGGILMLEAEKRIYAMNKGTKIKRLKTRTAEVENLSLPKE